VGYAAGCADQATNSVAIGTSAGRVSQAASSVAIGYHAGSNVQGIASVAIGLTAGCEDQGASAVAIGDIAGRNAQGISATAIGDNAGKTSQGLKSVAIGHFAALTSQGDHCVAIGDVAGSNAQGLSSTAVGQGAGRGSQGQYATAVGSAAASNAQGNYSVAVGYRSGCADQGLEAVAIGSTAGCDSQDDYAVAIGSQAGRLDQGTEAIAIGYTAGCDDQGTYSVAIGSGAAKLDQGTASVAIGNHAACDNQGNYCVAIGDAAGFNAQGQYSVGVGQNAGQLDQGTASVAIGKSSGSDSQGDYCSAMGFAAGLITQHQNTIILSSFGTQYNTNTANAFFVKKLRSTGGTAMYYDTNSGEISYSSSDDRLKVNERYITNALGTIMKLSPQNYFKKLSIEDPNISHYESGLMAQDVWYDAPELRHTVHLGAYADPTPEKPPAPSGSLEDDPDYSMWGSDPAQIQYDQLIPYTIKSIQEIVTELPRSKTTVSNTWGQNVTGLVVSANMNTHKTNVTPIVSLSNVAMDKAWYGVVSDQKIDTNDYDTLIDIKGDTQIWVTDVGGSLESGDLLTTSNVAPGYTQRQDDDLLRSSTVAKVTQDCNFTEPVQRAIKVPRRELSNVTYYIEKTEVVVDLYEYEQNLCERRKIVKTETVYRKIHTEGSDTIYFDAGENEVSKTKYNTLTESEKGSMTTYDDIKLNRYNKLTSQKQGQYTETIKNVYYRVDLIETSIEIEAYDETEVRSELVDVLDENGQTVWEETDETRPVYTLVDHGTHKAALLTCKLI